MRSAWPCCWGMSSSSLDLPLRDQFSPSCSLHLVNVFFNMFFGAGFLGNFVQLNACNCMYIINCDLDWSNDQSIILYMIFFVISRCRTLMQCYYNPFCLQDEIPPNQSFDMFLYRPGRGKHLVPQRGGKGVRKSFWPRQQWCLERVFFIFKLVSWLGYTVHQVDILIWDGHPCMGSHGRNTLKSAPDHVRLQFFTKSKWQVTDVSPHFPQFLRVFM